MAAVVINLAVYRTLRRLERERPPAHHTAAREAWRQAAREALDAAGALPPSWLENSPRPPTCTTTPEGSPHIA